jgi:DTW domain-containing protein
MVSHGRCYECFRPVALCYCDSIPSIDNRTEVLILQHRREHFHRFNTARIVQKSLRNSVLLADHTHNLANRLRLQPSAGLLYPGPTAKLISDLSAAELPQQLIVVDGTWHHAKTLVRDIPALQRLPRYRLAPSAPSRYRIRREPNAISLSTVEATVAALRFLEPETIGFERLLNAFEKMIEDHLAHPGSPNGSRFKQRRRGKLKNIPLALRGKLENIVVAYGESTAGERGHERVAGMPVSWVAQRLGDGACFACMLVPPHPLSDVFLGHLELTGADFETALPLVEAQRRWAQFRRPSDIVTVLKPGTARLLSFIARESAACLVLKSIDLESILDQAARAEISAAAGNFAPSHVLGRATKRLARDISLVRHLNALAAAGNVQRMSLVA